MNEHMRSFRDLNANELDTRTLLRNAAEQATARHYEDFFIADVDSHHYETEAVKEIAHEVGLPGAARLSQLFASHAGMSPSAWRKVTSG